MPDKIIVLDIAPAEQMLLDVAEDVTTLVLDEEGAVGTGGVKVEEYKGEYIVIPSSAEQKLATKQRFLTDDVTVTEIPYFETSNNSGGTTVFIGKEIEING